MENKDIEKRIEDFLATEKVYHYTSIEAALNIIISNKLRFGKLSQMNDCNEVYRRFLLPMDTKMIWRDVKHEMSNYKQLSFSKDNSPRCGYDIPAMWGHYAKKSYGACLVFDKSKIMARLNHDMMEQDVDYIEQFDETISVEEDAQGFFEKNKKEIFFKKTKDWSYEQEWRILVRSEQEETYLPFGNSLMAIIMNFAPDIDCGDCVFNSNNARIFKKVAPDIPILSYGLWDGESGISDGKGNVWSKPENWKVNFCML